MPITLPAFVAPNELIQSSWGNGVVNALDELDDEKVNLAGTNTLTGQLNVNGAVIRGGREGLHEQFQAVDTSAGGFASVGFYGAATDITTVGTRSGYVGYSGTGNMLVYAEVGSLQLRSDPGAVIFMPGGVEGARVNSAGVLVNKTSSSAATTGVEALAIGRINGTLDTAETNLVLNRVTSAISSGAVYINGLLNGTTLWSVAREGTTNEVRLRSDNTFHLSSDSGAVTLETGGTERVRANSAGFLVTKTSSDITTVGVELQAAGPIFSTATTDVTNLIINKGGSAVVSAAVYQDFRLSNSTIGSITRNAATSAVLYNTTSDARLKSGRNMDPSDGLDTIDRIRVRRYAREGSDVESIGFYAQELVDVIPQAVTRGGDDPATEPWMVAHSDENIIGHLTLAVQQLAARVAELEAA